MKTCPQAMSRRDPQIIMHILCTASTRVVAQATADPCAAIPARYWPDLLDHNGVVAELGRAHERSDCSLDDRENSPVHRL